MGWLLYFAARSHQNDSVASNDQNFLNRFLLFFVFNLNISHVRGFFFVLFNYRFDCLCPKFFFFWWIWLLKIYSWFYYYYYCYLIVVLIVIFIYFIIIIIIIYYFFFSSQCSRSNKHISLIWSPQFRHRRCYWNWPSKIGVQCVKRMTWIRLFYALGVTFYSKRSLFWFVFVFVFFLGCYKIFCLLGLFVLFGFVCVTWDLFALLEICLCLLGFVCVVWICLCCLVFVCVAWDLFVLFGICLCCLGFVCVAWYLLCCLIFI